MKRKLALLLIVCVLFSCIRPAPVNAAQNKGEYTGAVHGLIEEPNNFTAGFYTGNDDASRLDDLSQKWVDGLRGKGLQLNGQGDQVRFDPALMKNLDSMTIDLWVNWQGDATPETPGPDTGFWWQSLLGMSGPNGNLFKLMPANFNNTDYKHDNTILDGLALEITKNDREKFMLYQPVEEGTPSNALALGQWTYIAVTFNGETVTLYRDGKLFAQVPCPYSPKDFGFDLARIGSYWAMDYFNLPLNGIVDEAHLYEQALTGAQVESVYKNYTETPPAKTIFDENGEYKIVNEPGAFRDGFYSKVENFSSVGKVEDLSSHWVQGITGKALHLNGSGEHVLLNPEIKNELDGAMTFESWVKFSGDATPDSTGPDTGFWWQSLFAFAGPGGNWVRAMPAHFNNTDYKNGDTILNGAAVELQQNADTGGPKITVFQPVKEGANANSLPENEWCHFAFALDGENASIYLNGELFAQTPCTLTPADFHWDTFRVGNHFVQDMFDLPFFGDLDETSLYNRVRTAEEIKADYDRYKPGTPVVPPVSDSLFDANGAYPVIGEPGAFRDGFYSNVENFSSVGKVGELSSHWVQGVSGKGLQFNGSGEHVLINPKIKNELKDAMTFESWVKFSGDATPDSTGPDTGFWWQSMFTFSGPGGNWMKAMPAHFNNTEYKNGNTILDGAAVELQQNFDSNGPKTTVFRPVKENSGGNALPENQWCHFAFVLDGKNAGIYVNGEIFAQTPCSLTPEDFHWDTFRIGSYFLQDKFNIPFYGVMDETTLYNKARTAAEIRADYQKNKPADSGKKEQKIFDAQGAYRVIDEPGDFTDSLYSGVKDFNSVGKVAKPVWEEGITGKALKLNGQGQHVLVGEKLQNELDASLSVETWVRFDGDATPESSGPDTGYWWQSLFAFSGAGGNWIKAMPAHYNNTDYKKGNTILDGAAVEIQRDWDNGGPKTTVYKPIESGAKSTALPQGKWSHVAFTMDGSYAKLYVNGVLIGSAPCKVNVSELNLADFRIGNYFTQDKFNLPLYGALDDTTIYNLCRTPAQIKADYERGKARAAQLSGSLFENGAYTIVDEPENFTAGIFAGPEDDSEIKDTASVWVDGIKGKGIELDGLGRHIRFDPKVFQEGNAATVSLCVYWRGDATPDTTGADTGFWWQTLLGLSGPNGNLFRLMPSHFNNTDYLIDGTQLDGMALETLKNDSEKGTVYQPVKTGDSTTSLALEGWSHVAVTVDGEWIRLYLNGRLFAEEEWKYTLDEYNFDLARIGMYYLVDKFNVPLNAIVDECFVYDHAYSAEEIAQLTNRYDGLLTDRPVIDDTPSDFRQGYLESLNYTGEYPIVPQEKAPVPTALIIGLSLGGVAVLGGAGGTAAFLIRRKKKRA